VVTVRRRNGKIRGPVNGLRLTGNDGGAGVADADKKAAEPGKKDG
jgi:hypothetical protein